MGSSEIVDSGSFSGGRSSSSTFMQTCALLSQYLKQNKPSCFGDLNKLALNNTRAIIQPKQEAPTATMDLLPMLDKTTAFPVDETTTQNKSDSSNETAPLTIFYGGQVIVFNDFPAEKATEIMALASKSSGAAAQNHRNAALAPPPAESTTGIRNLVPAFSGISDHPALDSDLPIARKNSLARFLEKRKDRITANAPYPTSKPAARKPAVETGAWLELAPQFPPRRH